MLILISQSDVLKMCLFNPTNSPKSSKSFDLDWNDWLDQQNMLEQLHRLRLVSLLSLFGSDFSNFLINYWLIAVDSDHLCAGWWCRDSWLRSGSSSGHFPPSQSGCSVTFSIPPGACRSLLFILPCRSICLLGISSRFSCFVFIFATRCWVMIHLSNMDSGSERDPPKQQLQSSHLPSV